MPINQTKTSREAHHPNDGLTSSVHALPEPKMSRSWGHDLMTGIDIEVPRVWYMARKRCVPVIIKDKYLPIPHIASALFPILCGHCYYAWREYRCLWWVSSLLTWM